MLKPKSEKSRSSVFRLLKMRRGWLVLISVVLALILWEGLVHLENLPAFILPAPELVAVRFWQVLLDGSLLRQTGYTLLEVLLGLLAGSSLATTLGYLLAKSPTLERLLAPYLVASQAIPIVAIAPLLVIWFGPGIFSKILISALIVFFPVLVNTVVGLRAVPENLRDLMHSLKASRSQMLRYLEIPSALPVLLGGLRIGATLSVIGAVVGEWVGASSGLGFYMLHANARMQIDVMFAALTILACTSLLLYFLVDRLLDRLIFWQPNQGTTL